MELFFEVCRGATHVMADTRETGTVNDIKRVISGVTQITVLKPKEDCETEWEPLKCTDLLVDLGYTQKNAKPDEPVLLAYLFPEDNNIVSLAEVSKEPALPEAMNHSEAVE